MFLCVLLAILSKVFGWSDSFSSKNFEVLLLNCGESTGTRGKEGVFCQS